MDYFVKNFLFQLKKGKKTKKKKDRDPTILAVTNIHTRFYIQIREYPSTRILAAALIPKDREVGDIVQIVELTDVFSVGAYEITLYKG